MGIKRLEFIWALLLKSGVLKSGIFFISYLRKDYGD